ncbi:hypothetical protein MLD63_03700 [Paracoccus sp. TK19116]|uniref:Uncharacterized protein n=1 Tax=Paracoccus albicereus TaxID=2922394 RepID=A0ABT1MMM9_9RHOB|nr:hypothetical protein [Paracoccus albicereus]MCQ0969540.1 hypothetical protein [Paracoccus albicereus]
MAPDLIRLWGIHAPEVFEEGGIESRDYLSTLIEGKRLTCDVIQSDDGDRRVMRCTLPNAADIACIMVAAGHADDAPLISHGAYENCRRKKTSPTSIFSGYQNLSANMGRDQRGE